MRSGFKLIAICLALAAAGCVSQKQFLQSNRATAVQAAVARGQFEMSCPEATGVVISQEVVQPALEGPYVGGIQRAEYTVGVSGCGKKSTYIVVCPENGDGCFAAGPGAFYRY